MTTNQTTASAKQISFAQDLLSRTSATDEQIAAAAVVVVEQFAARTGLQADIETLVSLTVAAARDPQCADKSIIPLAIAALKDIRDFGGPRSY